MLLLLHNFPFALFDMLSKIVKITTNGAVQILLSEQDKK